MVFSDMLVSEAFSGADNDSGSSRLGCYSVCVPCTGCVGHSAQVNGYDMTFGALCPGQASAGRDENFGG